MMLLLLLLLPNSFYAECSLCSNAHNDASHDNDDDDDTQLQSGTLIELAFGDARLQHRLRLQRLLGLTFGNLKCRFTAVARPVGIFLSVSDGIAKRF